MKRCKPGNSRGEPEILIRTCTDSFTLAFTQPNSSNMALYMHIHMKDWSIEDVYTENENYIKREGERERGERREERGFTWARNAAESNSRRYCRGWEKRRWARGGSSFISSANLKENREVMRNKKWERERREILCVFVRVLIKWEYGYWIWRG